MRLIKIFLQIPCPSKRFFKVYISSIIENFIRNMKFESLSFYRNFFKKKFFNHKFLSTSTDLTKGFELKMNLKLQNLSHKETTKVSRKRAQIVSVFKISFSLNCNALFDSSSKEKEKKHFTANVKSTINIIKLLDLRFFIFNCNKIK